MRPENQRMTRYLVAHGIKARVKYIWTGGLKGRWRLWGPGQYWTDELQGRLTTLGFLDYDGQPLRRWSGNGGEFCVCVYGHDELLGTERARSDYQDPGLPRSLGRHAEEG